MADDPQSEFERIFGKTQKASDSKRAEGIPTPGATQKLPSDSDLLGIRTDSDRFIVGKPIPEAMPGAGSPVKDGKSGPEGKSGQDAMTVALNVNVFANMADPKKGVPPNSGKTELAHKKSDENAGGDGATLMIPLPKDPTKAGADIFKFPSPPATPSNNAAADEFTRVVNPKSIPAPANANTEFTRVLHVEDKVQKPTASKGDDPSGATVAITNPQFPSAKPPITVTASGPSDFTKVVKGSELRALQEKLATAASNGPTGGNPAQWSQSSAPAQFPAQPWQSPPQAPLPQYVPGPSNGAWPAGGSQSARSPQPAPNQQSGLSQYMPVLVGLMVLFFMAILLIVVFALKK